MRGSDRPLPLSVRPAEAARLIGISKATLYRRIAEGKLRTFKDGCATLILTDEIRAYLERLQAPAA